MFGDIFCQNFGSIRVAHVPCLTCNSFFKILMRNYSLGEGQELVLFLSNNKNNPAEIQMQRRLNGFMSYITEEYDNLTIHEVVLNKSNQENNQQTLGTRRDITSLILRLSPRIICCTATATLSAACSMRSCASSMPTV